MNRVGCEGCASWRSRWRRYWWARALWTAAACAFYAWLLMTYGCGSDYDAPTQSECAQFPDVDYEFKQLLAAAIPLLDPSPECVGQPHAVTIVSDPSEMPDVCQREGVTVVGCNAIDMNGFPHVWILDCQDDPTKTAQHERLHTLLTCIDVDDPNHERPIWDTLGVR